MSAARSFSSRAAELASDPRALPAYLDELEEVFDRREPEVAAFLAEPGRFDRLRREGEELAERFPVTVRRPPLYGLPLAVKDIFHVDGFPTHAGSGVPPEVLAGAEAVSVTRLRRAGALVLGKAVTTEFAYFGPGPTRNPHDSTRTPGGSSSGSAAAVASGMSPLALGTQTIGSISRPASFCGVVGFKPSYDRIPRDGVVPLAPSLDHVGFFTLDVADAQLTAAVLIDDWRPDPAVDRPRLAVPEGPYLELTGVPGRTHFERVVVHLESAGFEVLRLPIFTDYEEIRARHEIIVAVEAARAHEPWFERFGDTYQEKTRQLVERGREADLEAYSRAIHGRTELRALLITAMEERGVGLWLSPAAPGIAPEGLAWTGDPVMNLPWTHAGLPTLALPAGTIDGMPMGLQLTAGWHRDEELLAWGAEIERDLGEGIAA